MSLRFWTMKFQSSYVCITATSEWVRVSGVSMVGKRDEESLPEKTKDSIRLEYVDKNGDIHKLPLSKVILTPPTEGYRVVEGKLVWCSRTMERSFKLGVSSDLWRTTPQDMPLKLWLNADIPAHNKPEEIFWDDNALIFSDQLVALPYTGTSNYRYIVYQNVPIFNVTRSHIGVKVSAMKGVRVPPFITHWNEYLGTTYQYEGDIVVEVPTTSDISWVDRGHSYYWELGTELFEDFDITVDSVSGRIDFIMDGEEYSFSTLDELDALRGDVPDGQCDDLEDIYTCTRVMVQPPVTITEAPEDVAKSTTPRPPIMVGGKPVEVPDIPRDEPVVVQPVICAVGGNRAPEVARPRLGNPNNFFGGGVEAHAHRIEVAQRIQEINVRNINNPMEPLEDLF